MLFKTIVKMLFKIFKRESLVTMDYIEQWAQQHPLAPIHVDCAIAVMLKILDGKCKMDTVEKQIMTQLYDQVKHCPNHLLESEIHDLITQARERLDDEMILLIYEKRVLAETMISRPVMKEFKAMIREQGLFEQV
jgi:hypothetical protein